MHALPISLTAYDAVRVVPFNPFADRASMAIKRNTIAAQLSAERSRPRPDELLIKAYEIWLRGYHRHMAR